MFSIYFLFCNKREDCDVIKSVSIFSPKTSEPTDKILRQTYMNNLLLEAKHNFKLYAIEKYIHVGRGVSDSSTN
jgi:hypothetical protein